MVIGISSSSFPSFTVGELVNTAGKFNIEGIALETGLLEGIGEPGMITLREELVLRKIKPPVVLGHLTGVHAGGSRDCKGEIEKWFSLCENLGSKVLTVAASPEATVPELIEFFKEPVRIAENRELCLAMDTSLALGVDGLGQIVEKINSDAFGFAFDTGRFLLLGEDPVLFASYLGKYVHIVITRDVRQNSCVPLGKGDVRFPEIVKEMMLMGFEGMYCVEIDALHPDYKDRTAAVKDSVKYLNKLHRKLK